MRYFVIANDIIENVIEAEEGFELPGKVLINAAGHANAGPGWGWDGSAPVEPEPPAAPVPSDFVLSKRQISAALILSGVTLDPDAWMAALMAYILDPQAQALAVNDWKNAPAYVRDNPLFNDPDLLTAAGMTGEQIDALWMLAKGLPQ